MASQPQYTGAPRIGSALVSIANNLRDGTGNIVTVFTSGTSGSRIDRIVVKALGTTSAGAVRLYLHNGTNAMLFTEISVDPITASASLPSFEYVMDMPGGIIIPTGYSIRASTEKAESFNVHIFGGDF